MAKIKVDARLMSENEIGQWGVFISHSANSEEQIRKLCAAFDRENVVYLWDKQIKVGAEDFAEEIRTMINKSLCAVVVINEQALKSEWVNFEVGLLDGLKKKIFLYDEGNLLKQKADRYHYDKFCPAYTDVDELTNAIKQEKMFYELFNNDTPTLTSDMFKEMVDKYVSPAQLCLNVPGLSLIPADKYKFKTLVISFGNFTANRHNENSVCCQTLEEIENDICETTKEPCCLNVNPDREKNPECVLLNHVWEKVAVSGDDVEIIMPLHKTKGTTFKMFIDAESTEVAEELMRLFNGLNASASLSGSGTQNRVYFPLRSNALCGVFRLKNEFSDNYMCPGVVRL